MKSPESLELSIIDPIAPTHQNKTAENIAAYRGLIERELKESELVFSVVCDAMEGQFFIEHMDNIEFIHSRIESIGELVQKLAQEYEARLLSHPNCGVSTQLDSINHAQGVKL